MLRASASALCPGCQVRGLLSSTHPAITPTSWQQSRFASKFTKRTPSRMKLSNRVAQSDSKPTVRRSWDAAPAQSKTRRSSLVENDPFGREDRPKNTSRSSASPRDMKNLRDRNISQAQRRAPFPPKPRDSNSFAEKKPFRRDNDSPGYSNRTEAPRDRERNLRDRNISPAQRRALFPPKPRDSNSFAEKKPFRRDDDSPGYSNRTEAPRDRVRNLRDRNISPAQRRALFPPKFRDSKSFAEKRSFRRDDDSPGHLNRTEAPRDLVPPNRRPRNRGQDRESSESKPFASASRFNKSNSRSDWQRPSSSKEFFKKKSTGKEHFHALKMQKTLEPISYNRRTSIKERISELDDFMYFDLLHDVQQSIPTQALPGVTTVQPTPAQRVAIPALLGMDREKSSKMEQFLLAAETGSGKTLAYMVPIIDAMKRAELEEKEAEKAKEQENSEKKDHKMFELEPPPLSGQENPNAGRPRAIILVPSAELVQQVGALAKSFSHTVKFRAALLSASFSATRIRNTLFAPQGVDMVISTPHLLASIGESDPNIFSRVTHLVVDEADSLLDRSFSPLTTTIIDKSTPSLKQLIFCSATIPNSMDGYLRKHFPDVNRLVTPNIHAIPRRVQMAVVNVNQDPYRGNKDLACAETIHQISKSQVEHWDEEREVAPIKRIIVFVNEREKAVEVAEYLSKKGFDATPLNRDTGMERQARVLAEFGSALYVDKRETSKKSGDEEAAPAKPSKYPNTKVLVATDLGSRGIDTTAVRHVVLYDVPHTTIDFIHRIGRTGRMGRRGRAIVLLGKGDRADVVKEVRETMFKGQALI